MTTMKMDKKDMMKMMTTKGKGKPKAKGKEKGKC